MAAGALAPSYVATYYSSTIVALEATILKKEHSTEKDAH